MKSPIRYAIIIFQHKPKQSFQSLKKHCRLIDSGNGSYSH
ncbi:hypothetical protein HMPREF1141_1805 [Clostridium sp. MSTE9]|nr:hypothetical protein HMPREF1141_1805 [Clostridium sp. MSTE9]